MKHFILQKIQQSTGFEKREFGESKGVGVELIQNGHHCHCNKQQWNPQISPTIIQTLKQEVYTSKEGSIAAKNRIINRTLKQKLNREFKGENQQ